MRVAVVGTCASGKSTIVSVLQERGFDAYVVGQEHSVVPDLWAHQSPDALVFLETDYATVQARRGRSWPRWIYDVQRDRLASARAHATLVVDTSNLTVAEVVDRIDQTIGRDRRENES